MENESMKVPGTNDGKQNYNMPHHPKGGMRHPHEIVMSHTCASHDCYEPHTCVYTIVMSHTCVDHDCYEPHMCVTRLL